jgi:carbon-monoxide dehydrogenase medium subunit
LTAPQETLNLETDERQVRGDGVKAPDFAYARPATLAEVFDLLDGDGDARLLAGGQSLLPSLNMRLASPALLVDINRLPGLSGIEASGDSVRIGALARHGELARSRLIAERLPLLALAAPHVAHPAIRNRGTIGGSLALADPAAEWPACCLALEATMVAHSRRGERRIAAADFFTGLFETALAPGEVLTAIEVPFPPAGAVAHFDELARRRGDYAIVGLAMQGVRTRRGWSGLRLAFFGAGDRPMLAESAARALVDGGGVAAAHQALGRDLAPTDDGEFTAAAKLHLARVLLGRALAAIEAGEAP